MVFWDCCQGLYAGHKDHSLVKDFWDKNLLVFRGKRSLGENSCLPNMAPRNEGKVAKNFPPVEKWENWPNLFIGGSFFRLLRRLNPADLKVGWGENQFFFVSGNMVQWGRRGGGKNTSLRGSLVSDELDALTEVKKCREHPKNFFKNVPHSRHHSVYLNFIKSLVSKKTTPLNFHDIKKSRLTQTYLKLYDRFLGNWRELRINSFFLQDGLFNWSQG